MSSEAVRIESENHRARLRSAIVLEVGDAERGDRLVAERGWGGGLAERLAPHLRVPGPTVELDRVSTALWRAELERSGLPFTVRCLATWWRGQSKADLSSLERAAHPLGTGLRLDPARGW